MTIGVYYTPNGKMIDGKGIKPDITIKDTETVNGIDLKNILKLSVTVKPGLNDRGIDVYNAEKMLKALGYDVDTPDTLLDEKTFSAISKFQKDSNLYPYGVLDFTTQKALNSAINKTILEHDKQYAKAVEILKTNRKN
jgi:carboxyl-terminal processing protease